MQKVYVYFQRNGQILPYITMYFTSLPSVYENFSSTLSLPTFRIISLFDFCHPDIYEMESHCDCNFHLLVIIDMEYRQMLTDFMSSLVMDLLKCFAMYFKLSYFESSGYVSPLSEIWFVSFLPVYSLFSFLKNFFAVPFKEQICF